MREEQSTFHIVWIYSMNGFPRDVEREKKERKKKERKKKESC